MIRTKCSDTSLPGVISNLSLRFCRVFIDIEPLSVLFSFSTVKDGSSFLKALSLGSLQFVGLSTSASLPVLSPKLYHGSSSGASMPTLMSLAAGLPHFSTGFMRCWGRDTFIALRGLLLVTGRYQDARYDGFLWTLRLVTRRSLRLICIWFLKVWSFFVEINPFAKSKHVLLCLPLKFHFWMGLKAQRNHRFVVPRPFWRELWVCCEKTTKIACDSKFKSTLWRNVNVNPLLRPWNKRLLILSSCRQNWNSER